MNNDFYDIIKKINTIIEKYTDTKSDEYIKNIINNFISNDYKLSFDKRYKKCVSNDLTLSSRFIIYYDLIKNINCEPTSIINILPYFWFKNTKPKDDFIFTKIYKFYKCDEIKNYNILIDDNNKDAYNTNKLKKLILNKKYDLIHAELFRDKKMINFNIVDDLFISLCEFMENNLNEKGTLFIHLYTINKNIMIYIKNLIKQNIFTNFQILSYGFISLCSLHSYDFYLQLNNYTNKKINFKNFDYNINTEDIEDNIDNIKKNNFDKIFYYYYELEKMTSKENIKENIKNYIENNIIEYCNYIGLKIETEEIIKEKNLFLNSLDMKFKNILCICDKENSFLNYIISKTNNFDKIINKNTYYNIIFIENINDEIYDIFIYIMKYWMNLKNDGFIIIDNKNTKNNNYNFTINNLINLLSKNIQIYNSLYYTVFQKKI
jgi:hypothetical protein